MARPEWLILGSFTTFGSLAITALYVNYISISLYRKMLFCALEEGMSREDFAHLPTPFEALDEVQAVPADQFFSLHEFLDERLGPGYSVRVGQQMKIDDYGVLGLSWRTCSWAGEIFDRSERYFKLLSDTYVFKVEQEGELSHVYLFRDAYRRGVELSNEATFSATVVVLQAMTDSTIRPVRVAFKHRAPKSLESYAAGFGCEVAFEQPDNVLTYNTADLQLRTAKADESINRFLLERVEEETKGIEVHANQLIRDVELLIRNALPSGIPSVTQVGEHMGMSSRTLTRRLAENGKTFRDLIQSMQEEIARELLRNSKYNVAEIAFQTGFAEQSSFNRAFKRWTGLSPVEYRKS